VIPTNAHIEQETYQYSCNYTFSVPHGDAIQRDFADLFACVPLESAEGGVSMDSSDDEETIDASFEFDASVEPETLIEEDSGSDSSLSTAPDGEVPENEGVLECSSVPPPPTPTAIAIDRIDDTRYRLLIADEALPVIHVIEIDADDPEGFARLITGETDLPEPIVTGVPIRDLVVTPPVPKVVPGLGSSLDSDSGSQSDAGVNTDDFLDAGAEAGIDAGVDTDGFADASAETDFDTGVPSDASTDADVDSATDTENQTAPADESETEQAPIENEAKYIYAIDDLDGSVLVVDAMTGAVLTTHSQALTQTDRIPLDNAMATTLAIIAPEYKRETPFISDWCKCGITDETAPAPSRLYGVYLVVATTDGMIRVVDVHDMNAVALRECRHIACIEDGKRAFVKKDGEIVLDENENASYVLDTMRNAADFCSTDEANSCSIESDSEFYFDINERDNIDCDACCIKDEDGNISNNSEFVLEYNLYENYDEDDEDKINACRQCLGPDGTPIDFDVDQCQRCVNDEGDDIALAIRRHFPRLRFVGGTGAPISKPRFVVDERRQDVQAESGMSFGTERHDLVGIECDSALGMAQSFPDLRDVAKKVDSTSSSDDDDTDFEENTDEGAGGEQTEESAEEEFVHQSGNAFVCARSDPWTSNGADWLVQYEGRVQGAAGYEGKFVDEHDEEYIDHGKGYEDMIQFRSGDIDFCRGGVLGSENIQPKYLWITSELPSQLGDCAPVHSPILFKINDINNGQYDLELVDYYVVNPVYDCLVRVVESNVYTYQILTESYSLVPGLAFAKGYFLEFDETVPKFRFVGEANLEGLSGDMLVITAKPQEDKTVELAHKLEKKKYHVTTKFNVEDCEKLTKPLSDGYPPRVAFQIVNAYQDHLVIKNRLIKDQRPEEIPATYEFVRFCMAYMLMKFEVRVHNAYTVLSTISGFSHEVKPGEDKSCHPGNDPLLNSRAHERVEFRNRDIAFKLAAQGMPTPGFRLEIGVSSVTKMMVDIGSFGYPYSDFGNLPVTLMYDELYNQILVVDMGLRGLVPIQIDEGFPETLATGSAVRYQ
jgi:hypothetical protein